MMKEIFNIVANEMIKSIDRESKIVDKKKIFDAIDEKYRMIQIE
jgi:hypothetical protein